MKATWFLVLLLMTKSVASQVILTNDDTWVWANSWALFPQKNEIYKFKKLIKNNHEVIEESFLKISSL